MKKAKKRLAVVLVLVVAVNMLLQGGINTLAQAKPLEGSKDNSVKSEKSMSDKGKAPEKKQDNSKEKKNVKSSDPKKEEKGRINKDKKDQNDKNKNDKKDNKDGDKKDIDSDHQKDKKDDQDKKEHSKNPGAAIDKTKKENDIVAKVNAPAGAFTKGTTAEISTLSADSKKVAYDITFTDADNKEVQPQAGTPVKVSFAIGNDSDLIDGKEEVELKLYHIVNGESQLLDTVTTSGESTKLEAEVNHFSEFRIVAGRSVLKRGDVSEKTDVTVRNFTIEHTNGSTSNEFNYYERVKLNLDWDASSYGNTLKENDFFIVKLPDNMRFPTNHAATHFDLKAPDDTVVAKAVITPGSDGGGTLKATFTNFVENRYDIKGKMQMEASFWGIKHNEENTFNVTVGKTTKVVKIKIKGPEGLKDEVVNKWNGAVDGEDGQASWFIRLNHMKGKINHYVYKDRLFVKNGDLGGVHYIPDSFILKEVECDEFGNIKKEIRVINTTGMLKLSDDKTSFVLDMGDLCKNGQQYHLNYKTTYIPGTILNNEAKAEYDGKSKIVYSSFRDAASSGSGDGSLMSKITIRKVDAENNQTMIPGAVFKITDSNGQSFNLTTGSDGTVTSKKLVPGKFKIKEVTPPDGYELDPQEYTVTVTADDVTIKTITNKPKKISISGEKTWNDDEDRDGVRPDKIIIRLMNGATEVQNKTVTKADGWKWKFDNLPEFKDGKKINYTIKEDPVPEYTTEIKDFNVTNTHKPGDAKIKVTKKWEDAENQDGKRPSSINVQLYGDEEKVGPEETLNEANSWTKEWTGLPEKKAGKKIKYTVKEVGSTAEYTTTTTEDSPGSFTITNKHTPELTKVEGEKTWKDNEDQDGARPDKIIIRLLANGNEVQNKTVTKDDGWKWSFDNLPKYKNGQVIDYTIKEDAVTDYTSQISNFDVTNTHAPGKTNISVTKAWDDNEDQDGIRPKSIKVTLLADGEDTGKSLTLNEDNHWTGTFDNLDEKKAGKKIVYTVKEEAVEGYESNITGDATQGYTVNNKHVPAVVDVAGKKTWEDKDNQDGVRPDKIVIRLLADGTEIQNKMVTADDNWEWSFTGLPKFKSGKEIVYTITEDAVKDYTSKVDKHDVTNTHAPGKTSLHVTKKWDDSNDKDKIRPGKVIIHLYADGKDTGKTLELSKSNNWSGSFDNLDAKKDGKVITYTIKEEKVKKYKSTITGDAKKGFIVTNTHNPSKQPKHPKPHDGWGHKKKTGDERHLGILVGAMIGSLAALSLLAMYRRKKRSN